MKQSTFIILGSLVILVLIGAWIYLLFSGTPKDPGQIFADLGFGGEEEGGVTVPPEPEVEEPVVNMDRPRLRQLTTRPVIGFTEVYASTSEPIVVHYAEAGTGHVYAISLDSGKETRLSNTTVTGGGASAASFSPRGDAVAIRSHNDRRSSELTIGTFGEDGNLKTLPFAPAVFDFKLTSSSTLLYTSRMDLGLVAKEYNLTKGTEATVFTVPFYEATIIWGTSSRATHFAYPKPSYQLEGYLYSFSGGSMKRVPISGFGLTALPGATRSLYTTTQNYTPQSFTYNLATGNREPLSLMILPEKCTWSAQRSTIAWCGNELRQAEFGFPDTWYRGETSFKDSLWRIDLERGGAELLVNTLAESGREIDITNLAVGPSETALYFINKNDNTLWMYEL